MRDLRAKILCQQAAIDSYLTEIGLLTKEKTEAETQVLNYKRLESNLAAQTLVLDQMLYSGTRDIKSKSGIGFCAIPPPHPANYASMPNSETEIKAPVFVKSSDSVKASDEKDVKVESIKQSTVPNKKEKVTEPVLKKNNGKKKVSNPEKASTSHSSSESAECKSCCHCKQPAPRVTEQSSEQKNVKIVFCYYCKTRGHLVKDCALLAKQRLKRKEMLRYFISNNISVPKRVNSHQSPVKRNAFSEQSIRHKKVWRLKQSQVNPSPDAEMQNHKLVNVLIKDASGRPMTIKAWVPLSN